MLPAKPPSRDIEEPFWHVEGSAGTLKSGRWDVAPADQRWYHQIEPLLSEGRPLSVSSWPRPRPTFTYSVLASKPDVCTSFCQPIRIVSTRLRELIEALDAAAAQFLPIRVEGPGSGSLGTAYWLVNWLRKWDCLPSPEAYEIDPRRIDPSQHIGLVISHHLSHLGSVFCDGAFKQAPTKAGMIGLRYNRVRNATGPLGKGFYRDPKSRKRVAIERRCVPNDVHFDVDAFLERFPGTTYPDQGEDTNALYDYLIAHQGHRFSLHALRRLLEAGYGPNTSNPVNSPIPVFFRPMSNAVARLLHEHGVDWNRPNAIGLTPLMSASMHGEANTVQLMLMYGADALARCYAGSTSLHYAARGAQHTHESAKGFLDCIRVLLDAGVDPSITNCDGMTAADCVRIDEARTPAELRRCKRFLNALRGEAT